MEAKAEDCRMLVREYLAQLIIQLLTAPQRYDINDECVGRARYLKDGRAVNLMPFRHLRAPFGVDTDVGFSSEY